MNILFYTPVNFRCRDIESLAMKYIEEGHQVFLLSQCPEGDLHHSFKKIGAKVNVSLSSGNSTLRILKQGYDLLIYCRRYQIQFLLSHLEPTNFVSVIFQFFLKAKVVIYRHHINEAKLYGFDRSLSYRLTYFLAKDVISVSAEAKKYMIKEEKVLGKKIEHINLGYDFSFYNKANPEKVNEIRSKYNSELLLITVGRLTKYKRPELVIELVRQANLSGLNVKALFLGVGEEEAQLIKLTKECLIDSRIFFIGFVSNTLDYLAAADILIHPSLLESSCVVVKEAALVELPVMVCKGVGDFDNYMLHEMNGIVLDRDNFVEQALLQLQKFHRDSEPFREMGKKLKIEIMDRFAIDRVYPKYKKFTLG